MLLYMGKNKETCTKKTSTDSVDMTSEKLSFRVGLTFLVHFLEVIGVYSLLKRYFGSVRKSAKGISVGESSKQLICVPFLTSSSDPFSIGNKTTLAYSWQVFIRA